MQALGKQVTVDAGGSLRPAVSCQGRLTLTVNIRDLNWSTSVTSIHIPLSSHNKLMGNRAAVR